MLRIITIALLVGNFAGWAVYFKLREIRLDQRCLQYIKQAGDAGTVKMSLQALQKAIDFAETNHLTTGIAGMVWPGPQDDVEFWYQNMLGCRKELQQAAASSQLEQTNALMKVRESLLDGPYPTRPPWLFIFPRQNHIMGWLIMSIFGLAVAFILAVAQFTTFFEDIGWQKRRPYNQRRFGW